MERGKVIRIWNNELNNINAILDKIYHALSFKHPQKFASLEKLYEAK